MHLRISKIQPSKEGGFGSFACSMLAGPAVLIIDKILGFVQGCRSYNFLVLVVGFSFLALVRGFKSRGNLCHLALVGSFNSLLEDEAEGKKNSGILWALLALLKLDHCPTLA